MPPLARFFNSFGPGEVPGQYRNVIPNFIYWAMKGKPLPITGDGTETRDFTADRKCFPFKEIHTEEERNIDDWNFLVEDWRTDAKVYKDKDGVLRCEECELIVSEAPITCELCRAAKNHPKKARKTRPQSGNRLAA